MGDVTAPQAQKDTARRRGYLLLFAAALAVQSAVTVQDAARGDWRGVLGAVVAAALLIATLLPRMAMNRVDGLVALAADGGALATLWVIGTQAGPINALQSLVLAAFLVVWFGLLDSQAAIVRAAVLYAAVLLVTALRHPESALPVLFLGLLALLIRQMTFTGRHIRREQSEKEHYADLALTDPLTGLRNRRSLYTDLQRAYAQAEQERESPKLAVLLADIDHFKDVNDTYGHDTGDQVLQHVAGVLQSCVRPGDIVARWGGEEFLILVRTDDWDITRRISARMIQTLRQISGGLPPVTVSIGMALGAESADVSGLLRRADRRLYRAKRSGRDQANMDALSNHTTQVEVRNVTAWKQDQEREPNRS